MLLVLHLSKQFLQKKQPREYFRANWKKTKPVLIGPKLSRIVQIAIDVADRVIILMNANGDSLDKKTEEIKRYLPMINLNRVHIVLLDYEIEEWICYSQGIPINGKPSEILYSRIKYRKERLPSYASKLDCEKLKTCPSFRRLIDALSSSNSTSE